MRGIRAAKTMEFRHGIMSALLVLAVVHALATLPVSGKQLSTEDNGSAKQQGQQQSIKSSMNSLWLAAEENESLNGGEETEGDEEKDDVASLFSKMGISKSSHQQFIKCASCEGQLFPWQYEQSDVDEQSYCNYQKECYGATRCFKSIVREANGLVRINRGCVDGLHWSKTRVMQLNSCGTSRNSVIAVDKNSQQQQPYEVWTKSHVFSSAVTDDQLKWIPSSAIECCNGRDFCNDGPFPSLQLLSKDVSSSKDSILMAASWWRWSLVAKLLSLFVGIIIIVVCVVVVVLRLNRKGKQIKRHQKSKNNSSRRRRSKMQNRNIRNCEDGYSDDSDKKIPRHLSFSSESLSSVLSSSSCCEEKTDRKKSRRRRKHTTALAMVDLLKGVVVAGDSTADNEDTYSGDGHQRPYTVPYSPTALTESTMDGELSPSYQRQRNHHEKDRQEDLTSGSGYGMPLLVERTLAKHINLCQLVGKGRYGEVWRATYWNGSHEHVAVKIFLSKDEPSWKRETEIYSTVLMRHDNILGFIGSDIMTSRNSYTTQLLLITHYHRHGSLYDFLQTNVTGEPISSAYEIGVGDTSGGRLQQNNRGRPPLTTVQMLNVLYSVASGLLHLHTEIYGTQGKPGIAHRDVKSKNILVKCAVTGTCCVADFGMAVTSRDASLPIQTTTGSVSASNIQNTRVGTKRYMAPEVLDDSIMAMVLLMSTTSAASASTASASASTTSSSTSNTWASASTTSAALASTASASVAASSSSVSSSTTTTASKCFTAYTRGDVYSYALVMWEVLSRTIMPHSARDPEDGGVVVSEPTKNNGEQGQQQPPRTPATDNGYDPYVYRAPYQDRGASWDPGFDDMRRIVCSDDPVLSRPGVAAEWLTEPVMKDLVWIMRECWHRNPCARPTFLRVKKTLSKVMEQYATTEAKQQQCNAEPKQLNVMVEQL